MPLRIHEYHLRDWCRLRPLLHVLKTQRYRRIDRCYLAQPADPVEGERVGKAVRGRQVLVTIAFNDVETIYLQLKQVAANLGHAMHLIADNSSHQPASSAIQAMCQQRQVAYLKIPMNPWTGRNPSRSHGFAMNWVWQRVLLPSCPRHFGFIDHDLFPTRPTNPFQELRELPCFGDKRWAGQRWFLWAGYCFFDFNLVKSLSLDFGLDWFAGLDTGGANWEILYKNIPPQQLRDRDIQAVQVWPSVATRESYFEWRDDWIHEVGLDGRADLKSAKRAVLRDILSQHAQANYESADQS